MSKSLDGKVGKDLYDYEVGKDLTKKKKWVCEFDSINIKNFYSTKHTKNWGGREGEH